MPKSKSKKDFNKKKLKVGKSKPLSTTHTDTSFTARAIHLPNQTIGAVETSGDDSFSHYLLLCKHHSATTRKEAVIYLKSQSHAHLVNIKPLFSATAPLIVDSSKSVRDAVLDLYGNCPELRPTLAVHSSLIMLYVHSAMTHISPDIRAHSTAFLDILLNIDPYQIVRKSWAKTLECFLPLMGWESSKSSSNVNVALSYGANTNKVRTAHLQSLQKLLDLGLSEESQSGNIIQGPNSDTTKFLCPTASAPFLAIGFFKTINASGNAVTEDEQSRMDLLKQYLPALKRGLELNCKEAGQIGRISKSTITLLQAKQL